MMLFIVFVVTTWLAGRRAEREGMPPQKVQDLVLWTFLGGLLGARLFYVIQYHVSDPWEFFRIWNGDNGQVIIAFDPPKPANQTAAK